ncbi:hypothetical protein Peur_038715 [Populus x canadensis]
MQHPRRGNRHSIFLSSSFLALVYCIKKLDTRVFRKRVDKTILVEAMVLRLDHIGFLDTSNNNPSWKSLLLFFIFTVPWCSAS